MKSLTVPPPFSLLFKKKPTEEGRKAVWGEKGFFPYPAPSLSPFRIRQWGGKGLLLLLQQHARGGGGGGGGGGELALRLLLPTLHFLLAKKVELFLGQKVPLLTPLQLIESCPNTKVDLGSINCEIHIVIDEMSVKIMWSNP